MTFQPTCAIPPPSRPAIAFVGRSAIVELPEIDHWEREDYTPNGCDARTTNRSDAVTGAIVRTATDSELSEVAQEVLARAELRIQSRYAQEHLTKQNALLKSKLSGTSEMKEYVGPRRFTFSVLHC